VRLKFHGAMYWHDTYKRLVWPVRWHKSVRRS